jgi:arylsulfatase A-like enzyme/HEAT repeat protein
LGGIAGAMSALSDYGAHWLWLDGARDRAWLGVCLLGSAVPAGAALGTVLGMLLGATEAPIERAVAERAPDAATRRRFGDRLRALRSTALATPALIWIGLSLFRGGKMSRLPAKPLLEALACGLLLTGVLFVSYLAHRADGRLPSGTKGRTRAALALVLGALALDKLNQWVLPGLYDPLHGALSVSAFLFEMAAGWLVLGAPLGVRRARALALAMPPSLAVLAFSFSATLAHLDQNQNVRVALMSPSVPHARSLLQALGPILIEPAQRRAMADAQRKARLAHTHRARAIRQSSGPVLEDAHVLLITVDALRPDHLGSYGYKRLTSPQLDRLAAQSVVFERAYAQAPHSSYSLCSLMTSEYLHETLDLGQPPPQQTLATVMAQAGYHTAAFYSEGIFHTAAERLGVYERDAFGFALHDQVTYTAEQLTDRVLQEVDRTLARGEPNSLFWVHYFDVHEPYLSTHFGSSAQDRYDSEILHVDGEIARLIRGVRQRLKRSVIVAISADHGEEFYEHGGVYHGSTLYEEQVRVPLILNAPGLAQRRVTAPVKSLDIAPTLLAWVGLDAPQSMRGDDLRALAVGQSDGLGPAFSAVIHKKMIVRWPYKLIADLRFGLFELYDLERDPHERESLADQRPDLLAALRGEVYGWIDALASHVDDPSTVALDRGRVGDRRAVEPLMRLVAERNAPVEQRMEAARILGRLDDERATPALMLAMAAADQPRVAAEAAIALGRMFDPRAHHALQRLVEAEDPQIRTRAGVSLARLRDVRAVPALIDALYVGQDDYERQEAVRWLGRLRDARALGPLIQTLPERRTRYLIPVALGMIGDARAYEPLMDVLTWDRHPDVLDATLQGLGLLADARAIGPIVELAATDPSLKLATESLVRLGALTTGAIGGTDVSRDDAPSQDFERCYVGPLRHDWDYQRRTSCITRSNHATLSLRVPSAVAKARGGVVAVLSIKRVDAAGVAPLELTLGSRALDAIQVDGAWAEYRWTLPANSLQEGRLNARLTSPDAGARFAVDHLLLLPSASETLAQREP